MENVNNVNVAEQTPMPNKNMKACKTCGAQIAKNAKACPACGAKNKKPLLKRPAFVILLLFVLLVGGFIAKVVLSNLSSKAFVIDNNGNGISITKNELASLARENKSSFEKQYRGAEISFKGTVKSVSTNVYVNGSSIPVDIIEFKEGWKVYLYHLGIYDIDISNLKKEQSLV